ncbi:MAG: 50S ribosomal protein L24 [Gemmatimonadetes bacterium]|nr:50S ribosomal protein L24 [Gemmatimonadota bacterium]
MALKRTVRSGASNKTAPSKLFVRKGDRVQVMRGNERGKEGTVLRVDREKNRVVIEGVNLRKRHMRPSAVSPEGGIISFEAPISASNVMLLDPETGKPTRLRTKQNDDGTKDRVAAKSGRALPRATR